LTVWDKDEGLKGMMLTCSTSMVTNRNNEFRFLVTSATQI